MQSREMQSYGTCAIFTDFRFSSVPMGVTAQHHVFRKIILLNMLHARIQKVLPEGVYL